MDKNTVFALISKNFSGIKIDKIQKIGEGTANLAYEINEHLIFRFPKLPANQIQLAQEISIQSVLQECSSLPYPRFEYLPKDHSFVGYEKLLGNPLIQEIDNFDSWEVFSEQIGNFLNRLHAISSKKLEKLDLLVEKKSFTDWQKHSFMFYEKTKNIIPGKYYSEIELFFSSKLLDQNIDNVLCHNDLGIEHILISDNKVTGVIDWGGVAITDPACDFARIYRDLGPKILDMVLAKYHVTQELRVKIKERAVFYGKCLIFEDMFFGIEDEIYLKKSLRALEWMFAKDKNLQN